MKAHVEQARAASPVRSFFDNVWVLIGLLGLLILGGIWWYKSQQTTPEELFARGEELMQRPAGPAWDEARAKCFEPLLDLDAAQWSPRVAPYLDRINANDVERRLLGNSSRRGAARPDSEPERIVQQALEQRERGNVAVAEEMLAALAALLGDDPEHDYWRRVTQQLLRDLREQPGETGEEEDPYALLTAAMARADALAGQDQSAEARSVWEGVIRLYESDPGAADQVALARQRLMDSADEEQQGR
jgi:hypothetical protein